MTTAAFMCAGCNGVFEWVTEAPADPDTAEIKTIGGRFCVGCIDKECEANGLPLHLIMELRARRARQRAHEGKR